MTGVVTLHTSYWAHSNLRGTFLGPVVSNGGCELGCRSDLLQGLTHGLLSFKQRLKGMDSGAEAAPTEDRGTHRVSCSPEALGFCCELHGIGLAWSLMFLASLLRIIRL